MHRDENRMTPPKAAATLVWDDYNDILPDDDDDAAANLKRAQELEAKRHAEQVAEDEKQSQLLAELEVKKQIEQQKAEAARKAIEIEKLEEEHRQRLETEKARLKAEAAERETYMTLKEAKKAAELEVCADANRYKAHTHTSVWHPASLRCKSIALPPPPHTHTDHPKRLVMNVIAQAKKTKKLEDDARKEKEARTREYQVIEFKRKKIETDQAKQTQVMACSDIEVRLECDLCAWD